MQRGRRILVVEDAPMVAEVVERYLRQDGHEVRIVGDGHAAVAMFVHFQPELIVLDLMLPGMDGLAVCRWVRERAQTPVIMLTARAEEIDKLLGLELGADDYLTKPFSPRELAARVKTVLRRADQSGQDDGDALHFDDLHINARTRVVVGSSGPIALTAREFDILLFLANHPGQVFRREALMNAVWHYDFPGDANTVTVHMRRLREKVETDPSRPRHLKTVWGVGYKFAP